MESGWRGGRFTRKGSLAILLELTLACLYKYTCLTKHLKHPQVNNAANLRAGHGLDQSI